MIEHARPHPQHKPTNLDLMTRLLEAKDKDSAALPGPLIDDDYELSLEECFANYDGDDRCNPPTCIEIDTSSESSSQVAGTRATGRGWACLER